MGHRDMVLLLLNYGADANLKGKNGTAREVALESKNLGIYEILGGDPEKAAEICSRFTSPDDHQRIIRCQRAVRKVFRDPTFPLRSATRKLKLTNDTDLLDARKRHLKLRELYASQGRYVEHLKMLVKHFLIPFREYSRTPNSALEPHHNHSIFSNVEALLVFTRRIQKQLGQRMNDGANVFSTIGGYFLSIIPGLQIYADYVTNYELAISALQQLRKTPEIRDLIQRCEERSGQRNNIGSYLIMPIQQLPKYNLFIQDVCKLTPKYHIDHDDTMLACERLETVIEAINKLSATHEQKTQA